MNMKGKDIINISVLCISLKREVDLPSFNFSYISSLGDPNVQPE